MRLVRILGGSLWGVSFDLPHVLCDFWQFKHDRLAFLRRTGVSLSSDDPGISHPIEIIAREGLYRAFFDLWGLYCPTRLAEGIVVNAGKTLC